MNERLESQLEQFCKLATIDEYLFNLYLNSIRNRLQKLSEGGLASVRNLSNFDKTPQGKNAIYVLEKDFIQCSKFINSISLKNFGALDQLINMLGGMSFFTGNNAGTGGIASMKQEYNMKSPAYFVTIMTELSNQLKNNIKNKRSV